MDLDSVLRGFWIRDAGWILGGYRVGSDWILYGFYLDSGWILDLHVLGEFIVDSVYFS